MRAGDMGPDADGWVAQAHRTADDGVPDITASTGHLGAFFDPGFAGLGLLVTHVVPDSPADRPESRLERGDVIVSVNGRPVTATTNLDELLDRTTDVKVRLEVRANNGKDKPREVVIRPCSFNTLRRLLYQAMVEMRRDYIHEQSDDRLAYVHISSMGSAQFNLFERDLYAEAHDKDAMVIDVRDNNGGWTTDLMLHVLLAGDHAWTVPRGGSEGYPQDRRLVYAWTKPVILLSNEYSFSNAEIFASVDSRHRTRQGPGTTDLWCGHLHGRNLLE